MNSKPRDVYLDAFSIDRFEVTAKEFRVCIAAGACDVAAVIAGDERYLADSLPMVNVTWQDGRDYCGWLGKRLPTEAEWERAARGKDGRRWPWGNQKRRDGSNHGKAEADALVLTTNYVSLQRTSNLIPDFAPDGSDGEVLAVAPGSLRWGHGAEGVYDLSGNVAEWVSDYFAMDYEGLSSINPSRDVPDARTPNRLRDHRITRGGSWFEPAYMGRTYVRSAAEPDARSAQIGFRCARDAGTDQ